MSAPAKMEESDVIPTFSASGGDSLGEDVLPFEVWSETSARLTKMDAERRERILAAAVVAPFSWESSELHWSQVLAAEVGDGNMDRATSHGLRCAEEMRRRRELGDQAPKREPAGAEAEAVDATAELTALRDEPALPFLAGRSAGLGAEGGSAFAASLARSPAPKLRMALGETMEAPALSLPEESAMPFRDPDRAFERWTPTQYASLCAELSVFQAHSREVLARYHIDDDAAHRRLEESWKRRIEKDPRLGEEVQRLYSTYRAYLVKA